MLRYRLNLLKNDNHWDQSRADAVDCMADCILHSVRLTTEICAEIHSEVLILTRDLCVIMSSVN